MSGRTIPSTHHVMPLEDPNDHYVSADQYVKRARLRITGRTLQRRCDGNPFLAENLGELLWSGRRRYYDSRTAPRFRELFMDAEVRHRQASENAAADAHRLGSPKDTDGGDS